MTILADICDIILFVIILAETGDILFFSVTDFFTLFAWPLPASFGLVQAFTCRHDANSARALRGWRN